MSRTAKNAVIAGAVAFVLLIAVAILLLTSPKAAETPSEENISQSTEIEVTGKSADSVMKISVKNEQGSFTFDRKTRAYNDSDGNVQTAYYWTSEQLLGVGQSDSAVRSFIEGFSALTAKCLVEENADDLEKYGLKEPKAVVKVTFDDDTEIELFFGIENPSNTSTVYFREGSRVMLAYSSDVSGAFRDVKDYANLLITKALESSENVDYVIVERKDLENPVEIRYMSEIASARNDENYVIPTLNTHRFVKPYEAEIDVTKGSSLCNGVCGLTMKYCAYLVQNEENLAKCGLSDPFCTVTFSYGGEKRVLFLGDKVKEIVGERTENSPQVYEVTGYYAALQGVPGIFVITTQSAPWYSFNPADYISTRPLSPYIYGCESVEVTISDEVYKFDIDSDNQKFFCGEKELDGDNFKKLFEQFSGSVGEEVYTGEIVGANTVSVKFTYNDDYAKLYGTKQNTLSYYADGDRKNIVALDGNTIFKVRSVYTERLIENVRKLLNGEEVNIAW